MKEKLQSVHPELHSLLSEFTLEMKSEFEANLRSLILYGSAAGENFIPKRSNINILMILKEFNFSHLLQYKKRALFWRKKQIVPPLMCTKEFLLESKDIFPIEWLEIMHHHVLLYGESPFDFEMNQKDIRLQCEAEIRKNQIRLRQAFLESGFHPKEIETLALASLNSIFPTMRAILILQKETSPPIARDKLISMFCEKNHLASEHFIKIWDLKKGRSLDKDQMLACFESYFNDLESLSKKIDQLNLE